MMSSIRRIRRPVKREGAEQYLMVTLLGFAASVILIRLFLGLTGYPQVGSSTLHIAHVLWGGLLLFVASLLPLLFANRWAYSLGALSAGVGVGLFIDEVGKFITQTNDYFFPAAAPIIYAFFLLTVLLYLQVRRPRPRSARAELYHAFDVLGEVLDHDLNPQECAKLDARLRRVISEAHHADFARLARALREFLFTDALYLAPDSPGFWERCLQRVRAYGARWDTPRRLKAAVVVGLGALGLLTLVNLVLLMLGALYLGGGPLTGFYWGNVEARLESVPLDLVVWKLVRLALGGLVGLLLMVTSIFMIIGQERRGFVPPTSGFWFR